MMMALGMAILPGISNISCLTKIKITLYFEHSVRHDIRSLDILSSVCPAGLGTPTTLLPIAHDVNSLPFLRVNSPNSFLTGRSGITTLVLLANLVRFTTPLT